MADALSNSILGVCKLVTTIDPKAERLRAVRVMMASGGHVRTQKGRQVDLGVG